MLTTRTTLDIVISYDSHIQEHNDLNRGSGTYEAVMRSINLLEEMHIPFAINAVLTKHTIMDFSEMREFFQKYKYCKIVKPIIYERISLNDPLCPSYSQIDRHYYDLYSYLLSGEGKRAFMADPRQGMMVPRGGCGAGRVECGIGPDGSLYPCRALYFDEFNAGNVLEDGFMQVWKKSSLLDDVRHADKNRQSVCIDSKCDLFNYCLGGCFGHTFAATGKLTPWATDFDCYRIKQQSKYVLAAMVITAKKGESPFETI